MKSNKGQALLEFILILPVFLMLFLGMIDFGRVLYESNKLENIMTDVVDMINAGHNESYIEANIKAYYDKSVYLKIEPSGNNRVINLSTAVNIYTPGFDVVFSNPHKVTATRVIFNE